jgi:hypothetical protein
LPVVNVITPTSNAELQQILTEYYGLYNYDRLPIRFGKGQVEPAGHIWYYPRTPLSSSLSADTDPPRAGTLAFYVADKKDPAARYLVTAGHVAREYPVSTNSTLYAPANKPFEEAKHSLHIALSRAIASGDISRKASRQNQLDTLINLDRKIGDVVYGTPVVKVGIRTGYTEGIIVSNANVRWKSESTHTVGESDEEHHSIPTSSAYAIQGEIIC